MWSGRNKTRGVEWKVNADSSRNCLADKVSVSKKKGKKEYDKNAKITHGCLVLETKEIPKLNLTELLWSDKKDVRND